MSCGEPFEYVYIQTLVANKLDNKYWEYDPDLSPEEEKILDDIQKGD